MRILESNLEQARTAHIGEYGSFLWCPKRGTLCSFMERRWTTGACCEEFRDGCILDDPEYQELQRTIEENRRRRQEESRRTEPIEKPFVRDQRNMSKSYEEMQMEKIHKLEELSRKAYHNNWPKKGEELLHEAMVERGKLRKWQKERGII